MMREPVIWQQTGMSADDRELLQKSVRTGERCRLSIILTVISFVFPILTWRYIKVVQGLAGIVWIIAVAFIPSVDPLSQYENHLRITLFYCLPAWLFGSLLALSIKARDVSEKERKMHVEEYHHNSRQ